MREDVVEARADKALVEENVTSPRRGDCVRSNACGAGERDLRRGDRQGHTSQDVASVGDRDDMVVYAWAGQCAEWTTTGTGPAVMCTIGMHK